MIRVPHAGVEVPQALADGGIGPRELKRVLRHYEPEPGTAAAKEVKFAAYSDRSVKEALLELFHGKCAYCESLYDATQPVDVEHWRPKGGFEDDQGNLEQPGYYWLAASWENLLPSCIDCNRRRTHRIRPTGKERNIGKANQFPVAGTRARTSTAPLDREQPLLLHPYFDDPAAVLEVDVDEGIMRVREGLDAESERRAQVSIEVYALNRTELVQARKTLLLRLRARMHTVRQLVRLLERRDLKGDTRDLVEDLITHELRDLRAQAEPDQPYSFTARQSVNAFVEEMTGNPAFRDAAGAG